MNNFTRIHHCRCIHHTSHLKPFLSYLPCIVWWEYFSIIFHVKKCALYLIKYVKAKTHCEIGHVNEPLHMWTCLKLWAQNYNLETWNTIGFIHAIHVIHALVSKINWTELKLISITNNSNIIILYILYIIINSTKYESIQLR